MQVQRLSVRPLTAMLALAFGAGFTGSAWADDPNPYYIGGTLGVTHDSNIYRTPSNQAFSDTYETAGVLGGIDQPFGRQRFFASGSARYSKYNKYSQLNNTNYSLTTGLDLSTINHLSGGITYTANQGLYTSSYGGSLVPTAEKNLEKSQQTLARLSYGLSLWSIDAAASQRSLRYSSVNYRFATLNSNFMSLGTTYRPSALISLGVGYRISNGHYTAVGREYHRDDIDLNTTWVPTGQSTVTGRLSYGRQKFNTSNKSDGFVSGSVNWDYRPTGKLGFNLWASRDTGAESSFFNYNNIVGNPQTAVGDNSTRTTMLALNTTYAATGKISLLAGGRYIKRSLNNSLIADDGSQGQLLYANDKTKVLTLGASYQMLRSTSLQCNVARETRSADGQLSYAYSDTNFGCFASITLK